MSVRSLFYFYLFVCFFVLSVPQQHRHKDPTGGAGIPTGQGGTEPAQFDGRRQQTQVPPRRD